jgi:hypothetical protein
LPAAHVLGVGFWHWLDSILALNLHSILKQFRQMRGKKKPGQFSLT